jgi:ABC-type transport system involved in multi-copper enzyme maturation permease subunit
MKNILIISSFTMREALAKKVFIFFFGFSLLILILLALILGVTDADKILPALKQDPEKYKELVSGFQVMVSGTLGVLLLFLAIFSSANFISSMLEKGTVDLFLSKPISREQLLWGKFIGGLVIFVINILIPVIGSWLIISLKFDYFNMNFLWIIITYSFTFAVLYSIVILLGVMSRSSFPGIMTSYFIFIILSQLLYFGHKNAESLTSNTLVQSVIAAFYYIIPKTHELMGEITSNLISGKGIEDFQPVITSLLFLILMMVSGIYLFRKKDF